MPRSRKNGERIEEVGKDKKEPTRVEALRPKPEQPNKLYNDLAKFPSENPYPVMRIHKNGTILYANKASEPLLKARGSGIDKPAPKEWHRLVEEVLKSGRAAQKEVKDDSRVLLFQVVPIVDNDYVNFYGIDITEWKIAEEERELTIGLLSLINSHNQMHELMKLVMVFLKDWSGCEAVGIRLQEGEDFPYFVTSGFPEEFVLAETKLCSVNEIGKLVRDKDGKPFLECMCGNIISGRFDPSKPFFTTHGSFWTNSTTDLLAGTTNADRLTKTRNRCNTAGYESVALVPLQTGGQTFGLLQLNSKQRGCFTPEKISLLERLADNLAIGLAQRKAEESMRESEDKFKTLADESFDSIVIHDGEKIIEVNNAFGKIWGWAPQQTIDANIDEFVTKESLKVIRERIKCGYDRPYEVVGIRRDGTRFPLEITGKPITYKGKPARIVTARDVTERKRAEEELRKERDFAKSLVETAQAIVLVLDTRGCIVSFNPYMEEISGYKLEEVLGFDWFSTFVPKRDRERIRDLFKNAATDIQTRGNVNPIVTKNGEEREIEWCDKTLKDNDGNITGVLATGQDITQRKRAEHKLLEYQKQLKRLSAQLTLAEELERRRIAGELHDRVSQSLALAKIKLDSLHAAVSSQPLAQALEDISSSMEKAIQDTRSLTFDLSNPILYELGFEAAVSEWLREQVQEKHGIATEFQDDAQPKPLDNDVRVLLFRNVRELLINCIKHANASRVRVGIRRIDGSIEVTVEDNGVGFDPTETRAMQSKRAEFGLFSIRESLEELGGRFEIESKPGAGCKAVMTAPLKGQPRKKEE